MTMVAGTTGPLVLPARINVDVAPYNDEHLVLLKKIAEWPKLNSLVSGGLMVSREQFLVYSLFRNLDTLTLEDLQHLASSRETLLKSALVADGQSFVANPRLAATEHRAEAQEIGEALGLSLMDAVFGTHEADWRRIPEAAEKTLDYAGSDGTQALEVECKGSFVENRHAKSSAMSKHRSSIETKKAVVRGSSVAGVRMGTITAIDRTPGGRPQLWVLDPPIAHADRTPRATKLIHRMDFLRRVLALVNPSSPLVVALTTRVVDLEHLPNPFVLDGAPLVTRVADESRFPFDRHRFFATRSVVRDGTAGGVIVPSGESHLFFAGIRESLVTLEENQDFKAIEAYAEPTATLEKRIIGVVGKGRFTKSGFNPESESVRARGGGYYEIDLTGSLAYSEGGLVFGWLDRPRDL